MFVSECRQADEEFCGAASVLASVDLESHRRFSADRKAQILVRITELYLAAGDNVNASKYVNRALRTMAEVNDDMLSLRHKVSWLYNTSPL